MFSRSYSHGGMKPTDFAGFRWIELTTNLNWRAAVFSVSILVAASLEVEWNSKLHALSEAEQNYERQQQADQAKLSAIQRKQVLALATNFPQLWNDSSTPDRERKRM